jgi:hypothetical protein
MRVEHELGVAAAAVVVLLSPAAALAASAAVAAPQAAVRTAPSTVAPVVATLHDGDPVFVSDDVARGWRYAWLADGRGGYVRDGELRLDGETEAMIRAKRGLTGPLSPRRASPWILRPELAIAGEGMGLFASSVNDVGPLWLTVGRNATERLSTEVSVGTGWGATNPGLAAMLVGRAALVLDHSGKNALTFGAGPLLVAGGAYDTVAFAHFELGWELRTFGYTFLLTAGPDIALNDSARQTTEGCGNVFPLFGGPAEPPCVRPFNRGDVFVHVRIGWGFAMGGG